MALYGYGSGWAGFFQDDTSMDDMKLDELKTAMTTIKSQIGRKIDLISFESCQLGMIEIFYQIRGTVDICIGSEDIVYDKGFPYHMIYTDLKQNPEMSLENLAKIIMNEYKNYYYYMDHALGAFYNDKIANLVENTFDEFASLLSEYYGNFKRQIRKAIKDTQSYNIGEYVTYYQDIYDFANEIRNQMNLVTGLNKQKADEIKISAEKLIIELESAIIYIVKFGMGSPMELAFILQQKREVMIQDMKILI